MLLTEPSRCDDLTLQWVALLLYESPYRDGLPEEGAVGPLLLGGHLPEVHYKLNLIREFGL